MELKEGMYVRYIPTIGEYTQKISKITKTKNCLLDTCYTLDDKEEVFSSHFDDILGASHNIIDLIEVGDYINGMKVTKICFDKDGEKILTVSCYLELVNKDIKSIVTKEQFESIKYSLEG